MSPEAPKVADRLARLIAASGPIPIGQYMAEANAHYYATRDPLGAAGDFVTSPEISQMFGELIGLWLADLWLRAGRPAATRYVELGPGRGTLAADALRAMRAAGLEPPVDLVETSPALRSAQAERIASPRWHDDTTSLPDTGPLLIVANEFFDALPIRQLVRMEGGWCERLVGHDGARFVPGAGPRVPGEAIPAPLRDAPAGSVIETSPASVAIVRDLSGRVAAQGGAALIVDYGHARASVGDTFQAVAGHAYADPWQAPGDRDLTAHVDFEALAMAARAEGVRVCGPLTQGEWLRAMGIELRTASLAKASPERKDEIVAARDRLVDAAQMGSLFKAMALVAPDWPAPEGF
ncbi:SAM-dependent methyltransferase [Sphingomonas sp. LY54]|uniref:class I SAM-dependent methyltransferase n=1 Tax=Sphingomonas sp. LY54 TaxID=3095343 RepID=UPI002D799A17|nr:SAM-dependent methyltransferase [Sphingomonas sp. LY54]WRP30060.1 SAM-dependent methyltransferase [Sphingomonas sp. LY54]